MGLTASLDMGSEKMVMALASTDRDTYRLTGIKILASQGIERGMLKDKDKAEACVRTLMNELVKEREIGTLNIALSGDALQMSERRVTVALQKRVVDLNDLARAEQRCREGFGGGQEELLDLIPVAYSVDRGELIADPLGKMGRNLEVTYQVYVANYEYLSTIRHMFDAYAIGDIYFYPAVRAYSEALDIAGQKEEAEKKDFVLVDLGAMGINVLLFRDGLLEYEARLPLGMRTIDMDITTAFAINGSAARKLKHEYGQALRSVCKNKKVQIPDTKLTLESRDLAMVVQSRAEELLEGVVFLLQNWGFDVPEDEIMLTGGGSRLLDVDLLLRRLSGHVVTKAVVKRIQTSREEVLRTPEYFVALGLLMCERFEAEEPRGGFGEKLAKGLKGIFGI